MIPDDLPSSTHSQPTAQEILLQIPEIAGIDARTSIIRIPPELDVPLTPRVQRLIDTESFRRLTTIEQLGFVSLVYPGARHSRFEHSLGVYRLALMVLRRLVHVPGFVETVQVPDAELFIVTALLHDLGHYPYCHLIEDLKLPGVLPHEESAGLFLHREPLRTLLHDDWNVSPDDVISLLNGREPKRKDQEPHEEYARRCRAHHLLGSILSGPIDIDKMDYLFRDSLSAGVPYGRHFDQERLIGSLCLNEKHDGLAITEKGRTAAELLVFARYVMFGEVYWHHAVRSATVMFQRAFYLMAQSTSPAELVREFCLDTDSFVNRRLHAFASCLEKNAPDQLEDSGRNASITQLLQGIFGPVRSLYKRVRQFSIMEEPELYHKLAGRPYAEILAFGQRLVRKLNLIDPELLLGENDLLIDSPPVDKEIEFKIDVWYKTDGRYRPLVSVSPVVEALAREQFDDYVKRVRIFAHQRVACRLATLIKEHAASLFDSMASEW